MVGWMEFNRTRKNKNKQSSDLLKVRWSSDFLGNLIFLEFHNKVGLVFSFNWQSMVGIDNRFCWHSICIYYFIFYKHICCTETYKGFYKYNSLLRLEKAQQNCCQSDNMVNNSIN